MNRVRNAKLSKGVCLQLKKILTTVVHSTADPSILPSRMFHICQLVEFGAHLLGSPSFLGKRQVPRHIGPARNNLRFQLLESRRNLLIYLAADTGSAQKERVAVYTYQRVDIAQATQDTVSAYRVERLADVPEKKKDKDDIPNPAVCVRG